MSIKHVAVIIVTYKTAQLTIDCLHSINAQRGQSDLVITAVVVDNSKEDLDAIKLAVEQCGWTWVRLVCPPKNGGFAYGNNLGVGAVREFCNPDYIHLLNPDTVVRPGAIDSLAEFLDAHEEVGIAGSSFENPDGSDWPFAFRFPTIVSEIEEGLQFGLASWVLSRWVVTRTMGKLPEQVDWVPGASMMIKRSAFDAVGGMDDRYFLYFEETDFCLRAKRLGIQTWYVPASRVMHIAGQSTKVTERDVEVRRMPSYWFESRRQFFVTSYGLSWAAIVDIFAVIARSLGATKRYCLMQRNRGIPHYVEDLMRYSVLWCHNRRLLKTI